MRAQEAEAHGEEEASVIVVRADGRARRSNAGKAAEKFLPEDIAALPQWGTSSRRPQKVSWWIKPLLFLVTLGGWVVSSERHARVGGVGGQARWSKNGWWVV